MKHGRTAWRRPHHEWSMQLPAMPRVVADGAYGTTWPGHCNRNAGTHVPFRRIAEAGGWKLRPWWWWAKFSQVIRRIMVGRGREPEPAESNTGAPESETGGGTVTFGSGFAPAPMVPQGWSGGSGSNERPGRARRRSPPGCAPARALPPDGPSARAGPRGSHPKSFRPSLPATPASPLAG